MLLVTYFFHCQFLLVVHKVSAIIICKSMSGMKLTHGLIDGGISRPWNKDYTVNFKYVFSVHAFVSNSQQYQRSVLAPKMINWHKIFLLLSSQNDRMYTKLIGRTCTKSGGTYYGCRIYSSQLLSHILQYEFLYQLFCYRYLIQALIIGYGWLVT